MKKMTLIEAILRSMEQLNKPVTSREITDFIVAHNWFQFSPHTGGPMQFVSSRLTTYIQKNDTRIKRQKRDKIYYYYLAKNNIALPNHNEKQEIEKIKGKTTHKSIDKAAKKEQIKNYEERDLHILLNTYLKSIDIYAKTIFHEQSNKKDDNQKWTHPDMIGVEFLKLKSKASQNLLKTINQTEIFKMYSYELKRKIANDQELKKAYFQAVSNSSWANYGYLVAFEISNGLEKEIERLTQSFGIGVIQLNANPFQSKIITPARLKEIDIKTIDKLCGNNKEFETFIKKTRAVLEATQENVKDIKQGLKNICEKYFQEQEDKEIKKYCKEKNIPFDDDTFG